ncbi:LysR family transcriptional regulator [Kordiimonas aquimaris]|uniref:LysR family transcriptional regulator n=1 Tax=Kordiimonas aquimaris TaxID=707591 RepID=UPI0021D0B0C6|nr:LysR family transcriptional regulator [Kordiimonas aquimaris]
MRLRHIEVFHAVYSSASVSNAAKLLNVSQPSISKVLKHAEDQLGYRLFERVKGKLIPTQEAHRLFKEVTKVYTHLDSLQKLSENLGAKHEGVIRIASTPALGLNVIPQAVASFIEANDESRFVLETLHLDQIITSLHEGKIDLGIVFDPASYPNVQEFVLGSGELVCVAPRNKILPVNDRISLADLNDLQFVKLHGRGPLGQQLNRQIDASRLDFNTVASVETYHMAKQLVAMGAGVAIIDEITARSDPQSDIQVLRLEWPTRFQIKALALESEPLSLVCQDFVIHLQHTIDQFMSEKIT